MAADSGPFPQSALETNKNGRLTDSQRQMIRTLSRGVRKGELSFAVLAVVFAVVLFTGVRQSEPVLVRVGIPLGCLLIAGFLVLRAVTGEDRLTRDLRNPRVESLEGPISKYAVEAHSRTGASSGTDYYLRVAGERFKVGPGAFQVAPDAGFVRLFFLSISHHVVNLERLPDRPLPEGTTPQTLVQEWKQALHSHDRSQVDEVRAEMAGTENALMAAVTHDAAPPPEESRDQRPLAEAILGTWSNGPITAAFAGDGTFRITMLGANEQSGHWSVDGDGKLVADLYGRAGATDAWIVGEQLTVSLGGTAVTLNRASD